MRQRCWSELLSEYNFEITYIKGTMNQVADALSRRPRIFLVLPLKTNLQEKIITLQFDEVYMAHKIVTKMKEYLKPLFLWKGMKVDIVSYVERCPECQQVKVEHRHQIGLIQPHAIPESK
jgi:hypothetical protein